MFYFGTLAFAEASGENFKPINVLDDNNSYGVGNTVRIFSKNMDQYLKDISVNATAIIDYGCALSVCTFQLNHDHQTFPINYKIIGVLHDITIDKESKSLKIDISTKNENAVLLIALPKDVIQSMDNDSTMETSFVVMVDGKRQEYEEKNEVIANNDLHVTDPANVRVLSIPFKNDNKTIEVIGTKIIPEYDSFALGLTVVSIFSFVVVLGKLGRLSGQFRFK